MGIKCIFVNKSTNNDRYGFMLRGCVLMGQHHDIFECRKENLIFIVVVAMDTYTDSASVYGHRDSSSCP